MVGHEMSQDVLFSSRNLAGRWGTSRLATGMLSELVTHGDKRNYFLYTHFKNLFNKEQISGALRV
jgi:hypothetical protein